MTATPLSPVDPTASPDNTVLYSGGIMLYPYPGIPEEWSAQAKIQAEKTLQLCTVLFGEEFTEHCAEVVPDADPEDFWENAARAAAAYRAAHLAGQSIQPYESPRWTTEQMTRRLGAVSTLEEDRHGHDPLLLDPLVLEHSGRWMAVGTIPENPMDPRDDNLLAALTARHAAGITHAVLKFAARKTGLLKIELCSDPALLLKRILAADEDLAWSIIRLMDMPGAIMAQDFIHMSYEYRLFVVDGQLVTGAGCVEEHTPFNRDFTGHFAPESIEHRFDTKMRRIRGNRIMVGVPSPVETKRALRNRYIEQGMKLAAQYGGTVGLDLALNEATNEIVVVELNTLPNCGLYAADTDAIYEAQNSATNRGYGTYSWAKTVQNYLK